MKISKLVLGATAIVLSGCLATQYQTAEDVASAQSYAAAEYPAQKNRTARFRQLNCPAGTRPHASGSCFLDETELSAPARSILASLAERPQAKPKARTVQTEFSGLRGIANYRVKTGDTVYALARQLCVPVASLQKTNGLNANYEIQIGQGLYLPANQC